MGTRGDLAFDRMTVLAESRGIPVIDQYDYIVRQGAEPRDAEWEHDGHWNAAGHQWATKALLEYLKQNQEICTMRKSPTSPPPSPSWLTDYESVAPGEPSARSVFDIHIGKNTLTYLKSPCSAADVQAQFFLHVVQEDSENLPADRRRYGFDNLDFHYNENRRLWLLAAGVLPSARSPTIPSPVSEPGSSHSTVAGSGRPSSPSALGRADKAVDLESRDECRNIGGNSICCGQVNSRATARRTSRSMVEVVPRPPVLAARGLSRTAFDRRGPPV